MRKIFFVIAALLTFQLSADQNSNEMKRDQFQALLNSSGMVYYQIMNFCHEKEYKFFKIIKMQYKDESGSEVQISGVAIDKTGDIIKNSDIPSLSVPNCNLEIICYKNEPKDVTCCDVEGFLQIVKLMQEQNAEVEEPSKKEGNHTISQVIEIKSLEELKKLMASSCNPVFVDCYGNSCPPCKTLAPFYEKVSDENSENAIFLKVNIDVAHDIAKAYQIQAVPTLLMFDRDELQAKWIGLPEIIKFLNSLNIEEIAKVSN